MKTIGFADICKMAAVRVCWENGKEVKELAEEVGVSEGVIRGWLKESGARRK